MVQEHTPKEQALLAELVVLVVMLQPLAVAGELVKLEQEVLQPQDRAEHLQQLFHHIQVPAAQLAVQVVDVQVLDQAGQQVIVMVVVRQVLVYLAIIAVIMLLDMVTEEVEHILPVTDTLLVREVTVRQVWWRLKL